MKKIITTLLLALGLAFSASAQNELVTTTVTDVTATSITAQFTMNEGCTQYAFMLDWQENLEFFCGMFGMTEEQYVLQFCNFFQTQSTTWTWENQAPNQEYIIFVVAHSEGADPVIYRTTATTLGQGTSDSAVVSISVSEIGTTTARIVFTPNEATQLYRELIIDVNFIDSLGGIDSLSSYIIHEGMIQEYYEEDDYTWFTLYPGHTYAACAIGKNGNDEWGALCRQDFSTLPQGTADSSVITITVSAITNTGAHVNMEMDEATWGCYVAYEAGEVSGDEALIEALMDPARSWEFEDVEGDFNGLEPGTTYIVAAMGQNANNEWGALCKVEFTTTGGSNGIDEAGRTVAVFPNPTTDRIRILADNMREATLYDLNGSVVLTSTDPELNLRSLANGVYVLHVDLGDHSVTTKVVKR